MSMPQSFAAVVDERAGVLVLGTMPGVSSLMAGEYYANKRNQFWRIMYALFGTEPIVSYEDRINWLKEKGVALWDVLVEAERQGSLDTAIHNERPNDIGGLLISYPGIKCIALNGGAAKYWKRYIGKTLPAKIDVLELPSTSPRNTVSFDEKLRRWQTILSYLN